MSAVGDFVKSVVADVLQDMLRKASAGKRRKRRKRSTKSTATGRRGRLEMQVKPAKRQTSRRKTARSRSRTKRST